MLINVNKFYVPSESPFLWLPSHTHCIAVSMGQELGFYFLHKTNALGLRCTQRVTHMPAENGLTCGEFDNNSGTKHAREIQFT